MIRALILIGVLFFAEAAFAAEELSPLIAKMVAAYGGRERLESLVAFRETGRVEAATEIGRTGPLLRVFARRPLRLRAEIGDETKGKEVRILDGATGWRDGKVATGPALQAMVLQAVRLDLPWQLLSHQDQVVEKPSIERQGKRLRVLEVPVNGNLSVTASIDPDTGHILYSCGIISGGPMGSMNFETAYTDFRTVGGRLFAFQETNLASGTKTADTMLTSIEILNAAMEKDFSP